MMMKADKMVDSVDNPEPTQPLPFSNKKRYVEYTPTLV